MDRGWRREAKRYGAPVAFLLAVTVAVLLVRSGLQSDPAPATTGVRTEPVTTQPPATPVPVKRRRFYQLRSGETLSDVAIKFDTTVEQLLALNPGVQPTNLTVGQRIRVK
ncbi:MAG TPA: LysM peptidoglycan-binding domain-containing protein [Gaiellaceae bacterium]|nr:LysM peptidoglycan-binding domain-containing protein [Gaiellaceae bacterium]